MGMTKMGIIITIIITVIIMEVGEVKIMVVMEEVKIGMEGEGEEEISTVAVAVAAMEESNVLKRNLEAIINNQGARVFLSISRLCVSTVDLDTKEMSHSVNAHESKSEHNNYNPTRYIHNSLLLL